MKWHDRFLTWLKRFSPYKGKCRKGMAKKVSCDVKGDYFREANSWADDIYITTVASRQRYRLAFLVSISLAALLTVAVIVLVPLQRTALVVVHQGDQGPAWVELPEQQSSAMNSNRRAQMDSELARYITTRESYDAYTFQSQFQLIQLTSNEAVFNAYYHMHNPRNSKSIPNQLSDKRYRTVSIESIQHLDHAKQATIDIHLAEVHFSVSTHDISTQATKTVPYVAIIAWHYRGIPQSPIAKWRNWDGFEVVSYDAQPRVIGG